MLEEIAKWLFAVGAGVIGFGVIVVVIATVMLLIDRALY